MTQVEREKYKKALENIEVREYHAKTLNGIFRGTIGIVTESQITPEVAKAADFLYKEVLHAQRAVNAYFNYCSLLDKLNLCKSLVAVITDPKRVGSIFDIMRLEHKVDLASNTFKVVFSSLFDDLYGKNTIIKACVSAVNVKWKTPMAALLYNLIDELPY